MTSLNFKVNNKTIIRDKKNLFLDYETTVWDVLNHVVLKRISCKWWPLFAWCLRAERLGDCKMDRLTASMFSGVPEVRGRPHLFSDTLPVPLKFSTRNTTAECCNGNFPTTCTFRAQSHPSTASLPSQCPTESTEDMLPHSVDVNTEKKKQAQ